MSDNPDPEQFRKRLLALQQELLDLEQTGDQAAETVELDQTRVGRLSRIDALQAQAMSQASNRRRVATLQAITAALARLDRGNFGICAECDEPINPRRLEFDPTVRLCISCADEAQKN